MSSCSHVAIFVTSAWGHARPMCAFVARMVQVKPVHVTFITPATVLEKVQQEIGRYVANGNQSTKDLISFVTVSNANPLEPEAMRPEFTQVFEDVLKSEKHHPDIFISEITAYITFEIARSLARKPIVYMAWCPVGISSVQPIIPFAENLDAVVSGLHQLATAQGMTFGEAADIMRESSLVGNILQFADIPHPVRDYELWPQEPPALCAYGEITINVARCLMSVDAVLVPAARSLEPKTFQVFEEFLARRGASIFPVGPLLPENLAQAKSGEFVQSGSATVVETFLKETLKDKGPNSVLYVSFGTLFPLPEPEKYWALLEVAMEKQASMIVVHPSHNDQLPEHIAEWILAHGIICEWAPQQYILSHPATGWFLTHCGINSTLESLSLGVPMICLPMTADQPVLAILVTQVLGCGYELSEIRRGHGLKYRASLDKTPVGTLDAVKTEAISVLDRAFGEEGKIMRAGPCQKYKAALQSAWSEDVDGNGPGEARATLLSFVAKYLH